MLLDLIFYGEIILPENIYVAADTQCNLWWSSIANYEEGDRSVYFDVTCDIGRTTSRAFVLDATKNDVGTHSLTIRARELRTREIIDEKTVNLIVSDTAPVKGRKNILMIGDSRTWHSVDGISKNISTEVFRLLNEKCPGDYNFVGSYVSDDDPRIRNFADNGRTYGTAVEEITQAGGVRAYCEANGLDKNESLDYITVMFGVNDLSVWGGDNSYEDRVGRIDGIVDNAKKLVTMLTEAYPDAKILIVIEPSNAATQDGFGYWYSFWHSCEPEWEFSAKALRKRIIEEFDCGRFNSRTGICTAGIWCDRIYGYPYETVNPSLRATDSTVVRITNNCHPFSSGYNQIADGIFGGLCGLEAEEN